MNINVSSGDNDLNTGSNLFGTELPKTEPPAVKKSKKSLLSKKTLVILTIVLVTLVLGGASYYFYSQNQETKKKVEAAQKEIKRLSNTEQVAKEEQEQLVAKVGQIVELPKEETPTIATVSDITKLKNQPFFVDAQNGDKVLIYTKDKTAYLYRPSTNKIITIAPVNLGENETTNTQNKTKTP